MDLPLDLNVAVTLLFTFLALFLASVFIRLRGGGTGAAPGGEGNRLPVEEVGEGEEGKEAAGEPPEEAAEQSPATPSIPAADPSIPSVAPSIPATPSIPSAAPSIPPASSIPSAAPSIPRASSIPSATPSIPPASSIPPPRDDAESKTPPLDASPESSLGHTGQAEGGCDHAEVSSKAEEEDPDSENEKLVVREPEDEEATDEPFSFKYSPGKLRGNQYKSMMTKEELEEEQRVQREQLAAIFRLMKEKK
ncbi:matrix-remodeling-associated protein 7 isoform X2 [Cuculus canorus]|uniref:matrix-remodeling-associated protein 7 isoform X2 n=1 Tax=Cuculus canorus TaxID=55661 RepID=UPI0023AA28F4|nr:matrix-remodeling-associated protein 7 isoform X2 [Cuculus canorus]